MENNSAYRRPIALAAGVGSLVLAAGLVYSLASGPSPGDAPPAPVSATAPPAAEPATAPPAAEASLTAAPAALATAEAPAEPSDGADAAPAPPTPLMPEALGVMKRRIRQGRGHGPSVGDGDAGP